MRNYDVASDGRRLLTTRARSRSGTGRWSECDRSRWFSAGSPRSAPNLRASSSIVTLDRHRLPSDSADVSARSPIASDACRTLVRAARDGSPEAVGRLFELCGDRLLALIRLRLGRELRRQVESRDVLQNTLLKGFENIDRFRGSGRETLMGWLAAIACNEVRDQADRYRRLKRDGRAQVSLDSQVELRAPQVRSMASALTLRAETSRLEARDRGAGGGPPRSDCAASLRGAELGRRGATPGSLGRGGAQALRSRHGGAHHAHGRTAASPLACSRAHIGRALN